MSEKRFYLGNNNTTICDRSQGGSDGFNMLRKFEVVDLLNEQQATISALKEENEQLRKELNDCEKFRYTVFKRIGELNVERK